RGTKRPYFFGKRRPVRAHQYVYFYWSQLSALEISASVTLELNTANRLHAREILGSWSWFIERAAIRDAGAHFLLILLHSTLHGGALLEDAQ
ncbi:MAG: hypothetical protein AAFY25_14220, partial [Pseudomonadota bacterium]